MASKLLGEPVLKYFDTKGMGGFSGRGGNVRFYMLANNIKFKEERVDWNEWADKLKPKAIKSGESPTGHLPVLVLDGQPLIETFAILRRLARRLKQYGLDEEHDYHVDCVVDASTEWRMAWLDSAFGSAEQKQAYLNDPDCKRRHFYQLFNHFIKVFKGTGPHVVGDTSSFADAVIFSILWDDTAVHGVDAQLWKDNPQLEAFCNAYKEHQAVKEWCKGMRPDRFTD